MNSFNRNALSLNVLLFLIGLISLLIGKAFGQSLSWETLSSLNLTTIGLSILSIQFVYTLFSIRFVELDELAILLRFGAYAGDINPGMVYVPFGICDLLIETKNITERDLPGRPELIFYGDTEDTGGVVPVGYVPALRVTFAAGPEDKDLVVTIPSLDPKDDKQITIPKGDPLLKRLTLEVRGSYGFRITDLKIFYETIGDIDSAVDGMDDNAIGGFRSRLSQLTVGEAMLLQEELAKEVMVDLTAYSQKWGISVEFTRITNLGISHRLNKAIDGVPEANELKKAVITTSEGAKIKLQNEGLGAADARYNYLAKTAEGEAKRAAVASSSGGQYAMGIEAVHDGLAKAGNVIVTQDNMMGAVASISTMLKNLPAAPTPQPVNPAPQPQPKQQPEPPKREPRYGGNRNKKGKK